MRDQAKRQSNFGRPLAVPVAEELASFLGIFFDCYMADGGPVPPDGHPLHALRQMTKKDPKRALAELKMAVRDCLEASAQWGPEKVAEADAILDAGGAITLTEMRRRLPETKS